MASVMAIWVAFRAPDVSSLVWIGWATDYAKHYPASRNNNLQRTAYSL